ncbi:MULTISPECIES: hypothetical protein [Paracoccus]|uniref:Nickel/cobalt transporter regulator n=1 Tax=Paracoccus fontiphilus TaxID=1815556 RepID=A0ABV7IEC9_9RHOB|nr:hypothetical protein [Paracoccus fontiphilus]
MKPKPSLIATAMAAVIAIALSASYGLQAQGTLEQSAAKAIDPLLPGDVLPAGDVHFIEQPGRYGLGSDLRGSRYAIVDGHLVRVDRESLRVQSVLRSNVAVRSTD